MTREQIDKIVTSSYAFHKRRYTFSVTVIYAPARAPKGRIFVTAMPEGRAANKNPPKRARRARDGGVALQTKLLRAIRYRIVVSAFTRAYTIYVGVLCKVRLHKYATYYTRIPPPPICTEMGWVLVLISIIRAKLVANLIG